MKKVKRLPHLPNKLTYRFAISVVFAIVPLCFFGCSKSSDSSASAPKKPVAKKTRTDLLVSAPWKFVSLGFFNTTTNTPYGVPTPDSLQNLVLTFNANNSFTETGGKTSSGTWAFDDQFTNAITLTTTSGQASTINWTYTLTATLLDLGNTAIATTYVNPDNPLQFYQGESLSFTH